MADIAVSVLARLRNRAKESGRSYQLCLQLFCQEEFLRRLEKSRYADNPHPHLQWTSAYRIANAMASLFCAKRHKTCGCGRGVPVLAMMKRLGATYFVRSW